MKKISITVLILLALLGVGFARPVEAAPEVSDAAATLTVHQADNDPRAEQLHSYLVSHNSPLSEMAQHFVEEADRLNLDWRLVPAIAGVESTFGQHVPSGSYNAWGWGIPTGQEWGIGFRDWKGGITAVSEGLRYNYIDRGAITIDQIGHVYAASPAWSWKVRFFIEKINEFTPNKPELLSVTI